MNRRWIVLALVFAGIVINYIDRGNLSIAAPSIMQDFRLAPSAMGVILSAFFWTCSLFQIPPAPPSTASASDGPMRVVSSSGRSPRRA